MTLPLSFIRRAKWTRNHIFYYSVFVGFLRRDNDVCFNRERQREREKTKNSASHTHTQTMHTRHTNARSHTLSSGRGQRRQWWWWWRLSFIWIWTVRCVYALYVCACVLIVYALRSTSTLGDDDEMRFWHLLHSHMQRGALRCCLLLLF